MKLSEMSTEVALDKVCELMPHISNIMKNKRIKELFISKVEVKQGDKIENVRSKAYDVGLSKVTELIPLVLKDYREDVYSIIAIIDDSSIEDIKKQSVGITIKRITELFQDTELVKLFS